MAFSRMIWKISPPTPSIGSWDYWTSQIGNFLTFNDSTPKIISKCDNKIAYYAVAWVSYPRGTYRTFIMISPDADAVKWQASGDPTTYTYHTTITDPNGIQWYISGGEYILYNPSATVSSNCVINTFETPIIWYSDNQVIKEVAQDLVNRIYAVPFHENYQIGQHYSLPFGNKLKTIRKAISTFLVWNVFDYDTVHEYKVLSDNAEAVASTLANRTGVSNFVYLAIQEILPSYGQTIWCYHSFPSYMNDLTGDCNGRAIIDGYESAGFINGNLPESISVSGVDCSGNSPTYYAHGEYNKEMYPYDANCFGVGISIDGGLVTLSNAGIDL